jgi:hypothetical protein
MNKLKEIWDQLRDVLLVRWEQFQETDTYISLRDRYENLSPRNQKIAIYTFFAFLFLIAFSMPYSWFSVSRDSVSMFEETKDTIQELLQVSQESKSLPADGQSIGADEVKSRVEKILGEKGISKDQIVSVVQGQFVNPQGSILLPAQILAAGVDVNLHKLNIKQVVDLGYEFDHIAPLVKILNMEIRADKDDVHYYDANYRVSTFSVKEPPAPAGGKPSAKAQMPPTKEQPR